MFASNTSQVSGDAVFVEDVFQNFLYTGNGSTQTITNGIDLSGRGGLTWIKARGTPNGTVRGHYLFDGSGSSYSALHSNTSSGRDVGYYVNYNANGFSFPFGDASWNNSGDLFASWTFREQPKFFDVVTWTGSNDSGTSIGQGIVPHSLGSAPGCVIIKNVTQGSTNWIVYHRSLSGGYRVLLNTTDAQTNSGSAAYFSKYDSSVGWVQTDPDSNNIYVGYNYQTNGNGDTLVAYLFAHNAGGFGLTGTDNVISCGSFTGSSSDVSIDLGYEVQFVWVKNISRSGTNWQILDTMRGMPLAGNAKTLAPNLSDAESSPTAPVIVPTATGMTITGGLGYAINYNGDSYIYIAIRRGPMKVPTSGTSVFAPLARTGTGTTAIVTGANFAPDTVIYKCRQNTEILGWNDRLRGPFLELCTSNTSSETSYSNDLSSFNMNGYTIGSSSFGQGNGNTQIYANWMFRRAPSFFDEVCYTGTGSNLTLSHNLQSAPELMIFKARNEGTESWYTFFNFGVSNFRYLYLNRTDSDFAAVNYNSYYLTAAPTSASVFAKADSGFGLSVSGRTYVAYLFATCAGVSKVGSYTGTGSTLTINCGFTGGARFVMIKQYGNSAPNSGWYVWDTARGMVAGTDPSLQLNSTAAESNANWVYTTTGGFQIVTSNSDVNSSGGTYIYLAIA